MKVYICVYLSDADRSTFADYLDQKKSTRLVTEDEVAAEMHKLLQTLMECTPVMLAGGPKAVYDFAIASNEKENKH